MIFRKKSYIYVISRKYVFINWRWILCPVSRSWIRARNGKSFKTSRVIASLRFSPWKTSPNYWTYQAGQGGGKKLISRSSMPPWGYGPNSLPLTDRANDQPQVLFHFLMRRDDVTCWADATKMRLVATLWIAIEGLNRPCALLGLNVPQQQVLVLLGLLCACEEIV